MTVTLEVTTPPAIIVEVKPSGGVTVTQNTPVITLVPPTVVPVQIVAGGMPGKDGQPGPMGSVPLVTLTQAEYDALPIKDPLILYVITDGADRTILTGTRAPLPTDGINGDFWIDQSIWHISGPKANGTWPAAVSMIGPTGAGGLTQATADARYVNLDGDSMTGALTLPGLVLPPNVGSAKGRFGTIPGTEAWVGMFVNAQYYPGQGWLLDDPGKPGWFMKVDSRLSPNPMYGTYYIPAGAGYHTDEYEVFSVIGSGLMTVRNRITGVLDPTGPSDVVNRSWAEGLLTAHRGEADPHPVYLTLAEGNAAYALTAHAHALGDLPATLATDAEVTSAVSAHDSLATAHSALRGTTTPVAADAGAAAVGTANKFAREDHKHAITVAAPVALSSANAAGSATSLARSDHVHIFPTAVNVGADPTGTAAAAIVTHEAKADPHPVYLTGPEGNATYSPIAHTHQSTSDYQFSYDSSVVMTDPGSGKVRTDTPAGTPSTQIAFNDVTFLGTDASAMFSSLTVGDLIYFQQLDNASNWGRYRINAAPTDNGTWWLVPVIGIEQHGTINKNQTVMCRFTYGAGGGGAGAGAGGKSILDYGADPTGAVLSDTAFADALAANPSVFVPIGMFRISNPITITSGKTIRGESGSIWPMSQIIQTTNKPIIQGTDIRGVTLKDLYMTVEAPASHTSDGVVFTRTNNDATNYVRIENCMVYKVGRDGYAMSNLIVSEWTMAQAVECGRHGINLYGIDGGAAGTSVVLNACYGNTCGRKETGSGIRIRKMVYTTLSGCASEGSSGANFDISACQSLTIVGCGSEFPGSHGFVIRDECYGVVLDGCWAYLNKGYGFDVQAVSHGITLTGCVELDPVAGAINSFRTAANTSVTIIGPRYQTATSYGPSTIVFNDGGGSSITGAITASSDISVNHPTNSNFGLKRNGGNRWILGSTSTAETAPANGTNLVLHTYDNTGTYRDTVFEINRNSGQFDFYKTISTAPSEATKAGVRLPHGATPTTPVNGDIWTTSAGLYVRIAGVTIGPIGVPQIVVGTTPPADLTAVWVDTN